MRPRVQEFNATHGWVLQSLWIVVLCGTFAWSAAAETYAPVGAGFLFLFASGLYASK